MTDKKLNFSIPDKIDLTKLKTFSTDDRINLVTIENLINPNNINSDFLSDEFEELMIRVIKAWKSNKQITMFIGAHVIKCGLSRLLIQLMKDNVITHIAGNGAVSIHDFELAFLGGTSEYVPTAIEDGSFGMWEETGKWMNEAIINGSKQGLGYAQSLAEYMENNPKRFPYRDYSIIYNAYKMGIPFTNHITIGTDIIHQHPSADFSALGCASGVDFKIFCNSIEKLENGVFMNFGSAVTGAEVFLKALSIARNLNNSPKKLTTANFDIIPLGDYRTPVSKDHFHYYYRPRKNIVNRPTSLGGKGFYIEGNHMETIPAFLQYITKEKGENNE